MGFFSSNKTPQEEWDGHIASARSAGWRESQQIASKMSRCPNNPRNGGPGVFGDDTSQDRRDETFYGVDDESNLAPDRDSVMPAKDRWR